MNKLEYGVRHKDGRVERADEKEAAQAYISVAELARTRAKWTDGEVVTRVVTTTTTDWTTPPTAKSVEELIQLLKDTA